MPPTMTTEHQSNNNNNSINNNNNNEQTKETVIIFDWDDTLLASSFLSSRGLRLDTDSSKISDFDAGLRELEQSVISVLSLAIQYGSVNIITNAENGWVQLSAAKFIPAVLPILNQVTILSARSTFEGRYPESPLKWKFYAFQEKLQPSFNQAKKMKNILSFGDSHVEREAVRAVTRGAPNTKTKSVKFAERPSMEQLRRQIELVTNCFQYIHNHEGDLDLQLTVTINNNNPTNANNSSNSSSSSSSPNGSSCDREAASELSNANNNLMQTTEEKPIEV